VTRKALLKGGFNQTGEVAQKTEQAWRKREKGVIPSERRVNPHHPQARGGMTQSLRESKETGGGRVKVHGECKGVAIKTEGERIRELGFKKRRQTFWRVEG